MGAFDFLSFIKSFLVFSPRQLEREKRAANFIVSLLQKYKINYSFHHFWTQVPLIKKAILKADGKKIACKGCAFLSGKIKNKNYLISSLIPSRFFIDKPNINFNPQCKSISLSNFYFAPAVAINRDDLKSIFSAKKVEGEVKVKPIRYKATNILVGNLRNPRIICFAHYDSIEKGAVDNASGVALLLGAILSKPSTFKDNLFVFCANEELSYDKPTYWGHGFREFERKFFKILKLAKEILVVDCVGQSETKVYRDENSIYLAFPIKNKDKFKNKIKIIAGDIDKLMTIYHSELDNISQIKEKYLKEAFEKISSYL
jgi:hypothetical protein